MSLTWGVPTALAGRQVFESAVSCAAEKEWEKTETTRACVVCRGKYADIPVQARGSTHLCPVA